MESHDTPSDEELAEFRVWKREQEELKARMEAYRADIRNDEETQKWIADRQRIVQLIDDGHLTRDEAFKILGGDDGTSIRRHMGELHRIIEWKNMAGALAERLIAGGDRDYAADQVLEQYEELKARYG